MNSNNDVEKHDYTTVTISKHNVNLKTIFESLLTRNLDIIQKDNILSSHL